MSKPASNKFSQATKKIVQANQFAKHARSIVEFSQKEILAHIHTHNLISYIHIHTHISYPNTKKKINAHILM